MKKSKNKTSLVLSGIAALFGLLMIIPMVIPTVQATAFGRTTGANLFELGDTELGTVAIIFCTIAMAVLILLAICEVLKIAKINVPRVVGIVLSLVGLVTTIAGFVFLICYVSDLNQIANIVSLAVGSFLFLAFGLVSSVSGILANRK